MTISAILLVLLVSIPLTFVVLNRLRVDTAALIIAASLALLQYAGLGMLGPERTPGDAVRAISGFGQPVVITLIGLFIITRALEKSGVTRWLVQKLLALGGPSEARLIPLFAGASALLSLFMNNVAAGALLLPGAMEVSRRTNVRPSKLLIPIAYGSMLGGTATYFTTANIIVSDLLRIAVPPQPSLGILDFTPTGGLILLAGIAFFALLGSRLLPDRVPPAELMITRPTGTQLEDLYQLGERMWEVRVPAVSPMCGKTLLETEIGELYGITVVAVFRKQDAVFSPRPNLLIDPGDTLLMVGREERVKQLRQYGAVVGSHGVGRHLSRLGVRLAEVMPAPHSSALGKTLKELKFRSLTGLTAVALQREKRSYRTNVADFPLALGDALLVIGAETQFRRLARDRDFILLEASLSDQPVNRRQAVLAVVVVLLTIFLSILGMPVYLSMLLGAVLIMLARVVPVEEAYQTIEWQAVFLVAGMYAVSLAMVQTGLADWVGNFFLRAAQPFGPLGLAAGAYLITAVLTQTMGGQVAALVTGPIVISAAISMNTSPQAIAVAAAIGCSASFFTPLSHPVNILMITPANYTFGDFFRVGWRLTILSFVMLLVGMKLFWGL